ncbi:MAG: peptidylprolyl isomerase [Helicobacteraceae bacterium]
MNKKILVGSLAVFLAASTCTAQTYATFKGGKITSADVEEVLKTTPNAPALKDLPKQTIEAIVKQMVEKKLLASYALTTSATKTKDFKEKLELVKEGLAAQTYIEEEFKKIKVTDKDAKDFYEKNKDKFVTPEQVRAKHILVDDESAAKKIIKDLDGLKPDDLEKKFTDLAKEKSKDPGSKDNGGDLGYFSKDKMQKDFSDAAFALNVWHITKTPVKTPYGWHIILVTDKKRARTVPYEELATQMQAAVKQEKLKDTINAKVESLVKKANVKFTF